MLFSRFQELWGEKGDAVGNEWIDSSFKHFNFSPGSLKTKDELNTVISAQKNCEDKRGHLKKKSREEKKRMNEYSDEEIVDNDGEKGSHCLS